MKYMQWYKASQCPYKDEFDKDRIHITFCNHPKGHDKYGNRFWCNNTKRFPKKCPLKGFTYIRGD